MNPFKAGAAGGSYTYADDGPSGPTGPTGPSGPSGGPSGPSGPGGPSGPSGPNGASGPSGPGGPSGPSGPNGASGPSGPSGPGGPSGPSGPNGASGPSGPSGPDGASGPSGVQGPSGPSGPMLTSELMSANVTDAVGNVGTSSASFTWLPFPGGGATVVSAYITSSALTNVAALTTSLTVTFPAAPSHMPSTPITLSFLIDTNVIAAGVLPTSGSTMVIHIPAPGLTAGAHTMNGSGATYLSLAT